MSAKCLPVVADHGTVIEDSAIVVEYLESRYGVGGWGVTVVKEIPVSRLRFDCGAGRLPSL